MSSSTARAAATSSRADFKKVRPDDPLHLRLAFELEGLKEIVGSRHERKIVEFFAEAGHPYVTDDETAWCAAFAHAVLRRAGIEGTGMLTARSYLKWSSETDTPRRGDIVVFKRGSSSWQGHVAFFLAAEGSRIWVIGGNQGNAVSVASYAKSTLLGYRRVPGASRQEPAPAPVETPRSAFPEFGAEDDPQVRELQRRLRELGYVEVGAIDGDFGPATEAAIMIFRRDHGLPVSGRIDNELLAALMKAGPRNRPRANVPPEVVREQAPEVRASWLSQIWAGFAAIASGVVWLIGWVVDSFGDAKALVQPILGVFGAVPWYLYVLVFGAGFLALWLKSRQATQAGVAAYREGTRR